MWLRTGCKVAVARARGLELGLGPSAAPCSLRIGTLHIVTSRGPLTWCALHFLGMTYGESVNAVHALMFLLSSWLLVSSQLYSLPLTAILYSHNLPITSKVTLTVYFLSVGLPLCTDILSPTPCYGTVNRELDVLACLILKSLTRFISCSSFPQHATLSHSIGAHAHPLMIRAYAVVHSAWCGVSLAMQSSISFCNDVLEFLIWLVTNSSCSPVRCRKPMFR